MSTASALPPSCVQKLKPIKRYELTADRRFKIVLLNRNNTCQESEVYKRQTIDEENAKHYSGRCKKAIPYFFTCSVLPDFVRRLRRRQSWKFTSLFVRFQQVRSQDAYDRRQEPKKFTSLLFKTTIITYARKIYDDPASPYV